MLPVGSDQKFKPIRACLEGTSVHRLTRVILLRLASWFYIYNAEQGTPESRRGAIALYEQALKIARETGDRSSEATTLLSIGTVYFIQSDNQKAL